MVEEKMCRCVGRIVERGHCFIPFGEVVNDDYNVLVSIVGWRVACHEIDAPFTEGASRDYGVQEGRWCPSLMCI
jgi:hypothetical protein